MESTFDIRYAPLAGGGTEMRIIHPRATFTLPLDRETVLNVAASLLGSAGVGEASFEDGRLRVLREGSS